MRFFQYKKGRLHCEQLALNDLALEYGTPLFVYSQSCIKDRFIAYKKATDMVEQNLINPVHLSYAVKSNPNLTLMHLLLKQGAGFDTVSIGEIKRALLVGANASSIIFSGVGKSEEEIIFALKEKVGCISIESPAEFNRLQQISDRLQLIAPVALRINPDVFADTHPSIHTGGKNHKFGIAPEQAIELIKQSQGHPYMEVKGISSHIGSQILTIEPFIQAAHKMLEVYNQLQDMGIVIYQINLGGGFGIAYSHTKESVLPPESWQAVGKVFKGLDLTLILEPGRSLVGESGVLLLRVEYLKDSGSKKYVITDGAMNDMLRPALYNAYHEIIPELSTKITSTPAFEYDVTGPICETGDILARNRKLAVKEGDLLALMDVGAYGMSMSSNYNSRPRAAEVLVYKDEAKLIKRRESFDDMIETEKCFVNSL